ncbi:MAG: alpha-glucan family phosphorylase [Austwickia sp.]|nr:alpha-glucan family phosphorylase [Austwickia sp.]
MKAIRRFNVRTVLPAAIGALDELALNLRWSWDTATRELFSTTAPVLWERVNRDPVAFLSALSASELEALANDEKFVSRVDRAAADLHNYLTQPRWYQNWSKEQSAAVPSAIAYFSAEFGITEVLPQYSGGLGILAGDHLKSASDLGVPIVGVGLFYQTGYFAQSLNAAGWQQETYPVLDPDALPLRLVREKSGEPALVCLKLPDQGTLQAYVWQAQIGRVPLLLLDSNVHTNDEFLRNITNRLYGGGSEQRLLQEMLLGMGGVKALRLWSRLTGAPAPDVYHANEGHAGFNSIERISELVTEHKLPFDAALSAVRAGTVFTTHTPVPAGIDRFGVDLIQTYFGGDVEVPGVPLERLLALGAESYPGGEPGVFNMAVMGLRLAQRANGVSKLHGIVSREMFDGLWPGFDISEVPIGSITNGVHSLSWTDQKLFDLANSIDFRFLAREKLALVAEKATDQQIWAVKRQMREQLVRDARQRVRASWLRRGASAAELGWTDSILDPDVLTIGFARRVPTYKRLTLMLRDPERLRRLLLHPERPIQLVIAGKSHPADDNGKRLIQKMVQFADDPEVRHRIVFLPNYDIGMATILYPGCDVWLNNPLRPLEACGTSGMKAALNGGLNLSILDGWWDEWYDGENGWAIPTADGVADPERRDDLEAQALYELIEHRIAPRFYDVEPGDADGVPERWVAMMRHTLATLGQKVQATRMVRDYTETLYAPAARAGHAAAGDGFALAKSLADYRARIDQHFAQVRIEHAEAIGMSDAPQVGDQLQVRALIHLGSLTPEEVSVQLLYGRASEADVLSDIDMVELAYDQRDGDRHQFEGAAELARTGSFGWTVRVLPTHAGLATPAEMGLVVNP